MVDEFLDVRLMCARRHTQVFMRELSYSFPQRICIMYQSVPRCLREKVRKRLQQQQQQQPHSDLRRIAWSGAWLVRLGAAHQQVLQYVGQCDVAALTGGVDLIVLELCRPVVERLAQQLLLFRTRIGIRRFVSGETSVMHGAPNGAPS